MQVMIYVKDVELMDSIRAEASFAGRSVSNYLVSLHKANMSKGKRLVVSPGLDPDPEDKVEA